MKIAELRRAKQIADSLGGVLVCTYHGDVFINEIAEPSEKCGEVDLSHYIQFVGNDDPAGERWEFYSAKRGRSLREPRVEFEDGTELSLADAEARLAQADGSVEAERGAAVAGRRR